MHEALLRFPRIGGWSLMPQPEMQLVPAVTALNMDGFDTLVKIPIIPWQFFLCSQKVDTVIS